MKLNYLIPKIVLLITILIVNCLSQDKGLNNNHLNSGKSGQYKNTVAPVLPTDKMYFRWSGDSATVSESKSQAPHLLIDNIEHVFWLDTLRVIQSNPSLQPQIIPNYFNGHSAIRFYWESNIYHYYDIACCDVGMDGILTGGYFNPELGSGYIVTFVIQAKGNNDSNDVILGDVVDWGFMIPAGWTGSKGLVGQDDGGYRMIGGTIDTLKHIVNYTPTQLWLDGRKIPNTYFTGNMRGWHLTFLGYSGFSVNLGCRNTYLADVVCYYDTTDADSKIVQINEALNYLYHWKCTSRHTELTNMDIEQWDTTNVRVTANYMTVPTFTVRWYKNSEVNGINTFDLTQMDSNQTALWKGVFNKDHTYLERGDSVFITITSADQFYTEGDTVASYRIKINKLSSFVPVLTSDSSASPIIITASSQQNNSNRQKWRAFDGDEAVSMWMTAATSTGWIQIDLGEGNTKIIQQYVIFGPTAGNEQNGFKTWRLLGTLQEDAAWDTLDVQINAPGWAPAERREYNLIVDNSYRYYRWSVTANQGGSYLGTTEIKIKGVYTMVGVVSNTEIPGKFELMQNYPNPFNPSTNIKFAVPKESYITLKVYNMIGAEVRTLVDGSYRAGTYDTYFDGSNLASGVYLYKLTAGEFTQTRKMLLVK